MNKALILPNKQLVSVTTETVGPYSTQLWNTAAKNWRGVPIKAADRSALPVAWSQATWLPFVDLMFGIATEADLFADPTRTFVQPAIPFGYPQTLLRNPRTVNCKFSAKGMISGVDVFAPIAAAMAAANVFAIEAAPSPDSTFGGLVVSNVFGFQLPPSSGQVITLALANGSTVDTLGGPITVSDESLWVGGEVLNIFVAGLSDVIAQGIGWIDDNSLGVGTDTFLEYVEANDLMEARVIAEYPRYDKYGYHLILPVPDDAPPYVFSAQSIALAQSRIGNLAAYGAELSVIEHAPGNGDVSTLANDIADIIRARVVAFFGL